MEKLFKNLEVKPQICFGVITFCFCAFILLCTYLYPFTSDDVRFYVATRTDFWGTIKMQALSEAPRFLNLVAVAGLYFGLKFKLFFVLLNPFIQICIPYFLFYFVKGRKLNINNQADILPFLLICLMYLFMIPSSSTTLFWTGGAFNYSWAFLFSLLILCLFRYTYSGKLLKNTWYINAIWLFIGLAAGMSNENTGPMMFGISFCFIALCKYKHIKLPKYIYFIFCGIILGIALMFGLGGSYRRLHNNYIYSFFVNSDIKSKLFFSLYHFNVFLKALYFMPIITFLTLLLIACDKKMLVIKQEKFILSVFFLLCGLVLAFVLFAAPLVAERAYFSAGIFCIISLMLLLDVFQDTYKIYLLKYLTLCFGIYCLIITPLVVLPYFDLY
ncbi:MAG: DUF6056 family protein, partial [Elusimicrobiaceae bacterium]|nr:DUF6056 family protein [Elusimicrobiaceae bacterium]